MGSSRSAPTTETIYEPQRPTVTGTGFRRETQLGQAMLANELLRAANQASADFYANANIGRPEGEKYTPISFGNFDYTTLSPSTEELAQRYDERVAKERRQEKRREKRQEEKEADRKTYLAAVDPSTRHSTVQWPNPPSA